MTNEMDLGSLGSGRPSLPPAEATSLVEAASTCLFETDHDSPVVLGSNFYSSGQRPRNDRRVFNIAWPRPTKQILTAYADLVFAVERGGTSVAAAVCEHDFGLVVVARSGRPSGFDYWLGVIMGMVFQDKARLEVSGILRVDWQNVIRRAEEKEDRLLRYLPG